MISVICKAELLNFLITVLFQMHISSSGIGSEFETNVWEITAFPGVLLLLMGLHS